MVKKNELAKLGLAFAVGVSLSAGYVALGHQRVDEQPPVVVIEERCPDTKARRPSTDAPQIEEARSVQLAAEAGEQPVPDGFSLWVGLDGLWVGGEPGNNPRLLTLDQGRFAAEDIEHHQVVALQEVARTERSTTSTAVLWIDYRVPGETLVELLSTLGRAGFGDYALVVAGGADQPRAYRFGARVYDASVYDSQVELVRALDLSLRLTESGGVAAWAWPKHNVEPVDLGALQPQPSVSSGHYEPRPLDLGELGAAGSERCLLSEGSLPSPSQVAAVERELCELNLERGAKLSVEFGIASERSVGELLALRALDARSDACRGPSYIAAPFGQANCSAAIPAAALME